MIDTKLGYKPPTDEWQNITLKRFDIHPTFAIYLVISREQQRTSFWVIAHSVMDNLSPGHHW